MDECVTVASGFDEGLNLGDVKQRTDRLLSAMYPLVVKAADLHYRSGVTSVLPSAVRPATVSSTRCRRLAGGSEFLNCACPAMPMACSLSWLLYQ